MRHRLLMFLGRAPLTLTLPRWILGIALSYDGLAGLSVSDYVLHWPGCRRYESSVWIAVPSSTVSGVCRDLGVSSAVVPFPDVLGPTFGEEDALAAAVNLQRDVGLMLSNLQIIS